MAALIVAIIFSLVLLFWFLFRKEAWKTPTDDFPPKWRITLIEKVDFYNHLSPEEQSRFEFKVQEFLLNCKIIGVSTTVDDEDRVLIAASAVIPIFSFPRWRYTHLRQVLVYPGAFDENFRTSGVVPQADGMVGTGNMSGLMMLSKPAIYQGFANEKDRHHTVIHEFAHLIDIVDGVADGIPSCLLKKQYAIPWVDLIHQEIESIHDGNSDIRPYGATNRAEFFSVISEYFFENPHLLKVKHPEIYHTLERAFQQKRSLWSRELKKRAIGRNDPCPCNSGKKFKKCCGR